MNLQNNLFDVEAYASTQETYLTDWKQDTASGLREFKRRRQKPEQLHHAAQCWTQQEIRDAIAILQSLLKSNSGAAPETPDPELNHYSGASPDTPAPECGWLELYRAGGTAGGDSLYYRYSWREGKGKRIRHKHIPGGSQYAPLAYSRAGILRRLIAAEVGVDKCLEVIEKWKRGVSTKLNDQ